MVLHDTIINTYLRDNAVFADAFNFFLHDGESIINPDYLIDFDISELVFIYTPDEPGRYDTISSFQGCREILQTAVIKQYGSVIYALLSVEEPGDIYRGFIESSLYNICMDTVQVYKTRTQQGVDNSILSYQGLLSDLSKEHVLMPVIPLVLYLGADNWNNACCTHEMHDDKCLDESNHVPNYHFNLIEPAGIAADNLDLFKSSLRDVLGYIKYSKDMYELISFMADKMNSIIDATAARVICAMTKTYVDIPNDAMEINMCNAIMDLINDSKAEGMLEGMSKGRSEGIAEGICRGRAEGRNDGFRCAIIGLVRDNMLSVRDASIRLGMTEEAFMDMLMYETY